MYKNFKLTVAVFACMVMILAGCGREKGPVRDMIEVSVVNPMVKIFPDTFDRSIDSLLLSFKSAANEYEPAQFIIRSPVPLDEVTVELSELTSRDGNRISSSNLTWNFLGFIPLETNTPDTGRVSRCGTHAFVPEGRELIRIAPCEIPDPLVEERIMNLEANRTQPVWVTVFVPSGTPAGIYKGEARVKSSGGDKVIPMEVEVYPFELPEERNMFLTNWFQINHIARAHDTEAFSEEFWEILGRYARNLAEHRQNVVYTPWRIIKVYSERNGNWSFDYTNFDRFVTTFLDAGVDGRIEIQHIAAPSRGIYVDQGLYDVEVFDRVSGDTTSVPGEKGLPLLLANLQKHLKEKGWIEKSIIHVSDEPTYYTLDSWKKLAEYAKKYAPEIKTIDAIEATGFDGLLNIGVPQTSNLHLEFETFKKFQEEPGQELWFYTACVPYGHFPNRFLDFPLTDLRILHWMNYMYDVEGYLHWGLTYWGNDPFGPAGNYPPGDSHIIYPGKEGPVNSIRWETQRESLEDFEYFRLLESRTSEIKEKLGPAADHIPDDFRSKEIAGMLVKSLAEYINDPDSIYSIKGLLASEIASIDKTPLVLFNNYPDVNTPVVIGPAKVKIHGVVEENASVKVNGREATIKPDGSFVEVVSVENPNNRVIVIEVEKDGEKKVIERKFKVR